MNASLEHTLVGKSCNSAPGGSKAPFASFHEQSRGRLHAEPDCPTRSAFQRDRDRIVHSAAFRRLNHKTQVYICHEGDHYRTRLTHSLEVAQIARSLARMLCLDEDLAEAIALAHDFGHTPFGHAGERALDAGMKPWGGFDHNAQCLSVVTALERRYAGFDGLNLAWETLEGLVKHNGPLLPGGSGRKKTKLPAAISKYNESHDLWLHSHASMEAQIAAISDDIAYNNHDLDDGLRGGLYRLDDLAELPLVWTILEEIRAAWPGLEDQRQIYELNRRLITLMIHDTAGETLRRVGRIRPRSADDIRLAGEPMVGFSARLGRDIAGLQDFLFTRVYRHDRIMEIMRDAERVVRDLAGHYMTYPADMPAEWHRQAAGRPAAERAGAVRDFIAGMTDRYALERHAGLFDDTPELR